MVTVEGRVGDAYYWWPVAHFEVCERMKMDESMACESMD